MSKWPRYSLVDLLDDGQVSYGIVQPGSHGADGVPVVRVSDIRNGNIDASQPLRVDAQISGRHKKTVLRGGELVLSLVGTVGEAAVVPSELAGWNVARAVAVIRSSAVGAKWLELNFRTPGVRAEVRSLLNTTVQATLNLADLKRISISVPPPHIRRDIEEVMRALDDKIAANAKLVSHVSELSRAIFKSLAADGDHVPLSTTAKFVNGKAFTKGASGTGRVVIRIAELNSGLGGSTVYSDAIVEEQHLAAPGDLLFAWSGSLTIHRWFREPGIINQHIFKVIPTVDNPMWLVHELLRSKLDDFRATAADKATTMGHIQRKHLDESVRVPSAAQIQGNDALMSGLWDRALAAEVENELLAKLRDTLLPELMSGRLRVRDAEKTLEEVL